jgi:hypothetical protein
VIQTKTLAAGICLNHGFNDYTEAGFMNKPGKWLEWFVISKIQLKKYPEIKQRQAP